VNLVIGRGTPVESRFDQIYWSAGAKYLSVEIEGQGGAFISLGTNELLSVPYALYAPPSTTGGGSAYTWYDSGEGFWVCANTPGVVTTQSGNGVFNIVIPAGADVQSFHRDFTTPGEFTTGGEVVLTVTWTGAGFNTERRDARYPKIMLVDGAGVQRNPGDVVVTISHSVGSNGSTSTTISNINGLGTPVAVEGTF